MTPLAWRVGAYIVALLLVLAGLAWATHEFNALRATAARVPGLEQAVANADATLTRERKAAKATLEVSRGLQTDLAAIRADRDRLRDLPARVVRVHVPAPAAPVRARGAATSGSSASSAGTAALEGQAGSGSRLSRDIGTDLYRIVDDSDAREAELGAQVTRLQQAYAVAERTCNGPPP